MWLIDTHTLEPKEFFDEHVPRYAILSHCCDEDEVTLVEFRNGEKRNSEGFAKPQSCCAIARLQGLD